MKSRMFDFTNGVLAISACKCVCVCSRAREYKELQCKHEAHSYNITFSQFLRSNVCLFIYHLIFPVYFCLKTDMDISWNQMQIFHPCKRET